MRGRSGVLQAAQKCDPDMPVVLITGTPGLDTAIAAVEHSAFRYLLKPCPWCTTRHSHRFSPDAPYLVLRRMAIDLASAAWSPAEDRSSSGSFSTAPAIHLDGLPADLLVQGKANFRPRGPAAHQRANHGRPGVFLSAAERLNRMAELGRIVRDRVATEVPNSPAHSSSSICTAAICLMNTSSTLARHSRK